MIIINVIKINKYKHNNDNDNNNDNNNYNNDNSNKHRHDNDNPPSSARAAEEGGRRVAHQGEKFLGASCPPAPGAGVI